MLQVEITIVKDTWLGFATFLLTEVIQVVGGLERWNIIRTFFLKQPKEDMRWDNV